MACAEPRELVCLAHRARARARRASSLQRTWLRSPLAQSGCCGRRCASKGRAPRPALNTCGGGASSCPHHC